MKHKYVMAKNTEKQVLKIEEYEVLDKDQFTLMSEATYDLNDIGVAISQDKRRMISLLRNQNFFPVDIYADKLLDSIEKLYKDTSRQKAEWVFEDKDFLKKETKSIEPEEVQEEEEEENDKDEDILEP